MLLRPVTILYPLSISELYGIARDRAFHSSKQNNNPGSKVIHRALLQFIQYRQQARMALFIYVMFVLLFVGSFFTLYSGYLIFLCSLSLAGFFGIFQNCKQLENAFFILLGSEKPQDQNFMNFLGVVPSYLWVYWQQDRLYRHMLTRVYIDLGWVTT
ncbi:MAG: hypothetical protein RLZZ241_477 [Bacteroidota bacterium]|jgi:hypothetical protein